MIYLHVEAARRASQKNLSLSEESLQEYRRLRAQANTVAVDERQSLQALIRDEKTSGRTLANIEEAYNGFEESKNKLESEIADLEEKKEEVSFFRLSVRIYTILTPPFRLIGG